MRYTRTNQTTADIVPTERIEEYLRLDAVEAAVAQAYVAAAAAEIEQYADIALLTQDIFTTTDGVPGVVIALPVGPVADDATVTIEEIDGAGSITPFMGGFWLEGGICPVIHLDAEPATRLRITYPAGYGDTNAALPADLVTAVLDHTMKLFDHRAGENKMATQGLSQGAARIVARYRRVRF